VSLDSPMYRCPRFERCAAPICPLDADWRKRSMLPGEPVCAWLLEAAKPSWGVVKAALAEDLAQTIDRVGPEVIATHGVIRRAVTRASTGASKVLSGVKLRAKHGPVQA